MMRTRYKDASEHRYVKKCVVDDLHGLLHAETTIRRDSLVKFGNAPPTEEEVRRGVAIDPLIHNRIVLQKSGAVSAEYMMPFRREYTSTCFALYVAADLTYVGVPMADPFSGSGELKAVVDQNERIRRARLAVNALEVFLGDFRGAGSSRALPHSKLLEAVAVVGSSKVSPVISAFYDDYIEQTATSLPEAATDLEVVFYNINLDDVIKTLESKYGAESDSVKSWKRWREKVRETKTTSDLFKTIEEVVAKFTGKEKVRVLREEEIKEMEEEIEKSRKETAGEKGRGRARKEEEMG
jgi:CRISPR/Cas system-associated protein Cas7 (RAMP superfamily)